MSECSLISSGGDGRRRVVQCLMREESTKDKTAGAHDKGFTDDDIERWAAEAESADGYTGAHLGPAVAGPPVSGGGQARPLTLRLDAARRAKLNEIASERNTTPSQLLRDLIDSL